MSQNQMPELCGPFLVINSRKPIYDIYGMYDPKEITSYD